MARLLLYTALTSLNSDINRDLFPTLIGDRKRPALTAFDAWMATVADMFCTKGGLSRGLVSRAMFNCLPQFLKLARDLDDGVPGLAAVLALRLDGNLVCMGGPFDKLLMQLKLEGKLLRMTFVDLGVAAVVLRGVAQDQKIEIGDKIGMTDTELADLYMTRTENERGN